MPEDWKDLDSYAKTRGPAYGVSPTPHQPERLAAMERHVQKRVWQLLELAPVRESKKIAPNRSGEPKSGAVQADGQPRFPFSAAVPIPIYCKICRKKGIILL